MTTNVRTHMTKTPTHILLGFCFGVILSVFIFVGYHKLTDLKFERNYLSGGWVLSHSEQEIVAPDKPVSFNFTDEIVTITTADGKVYSCSYNITKENDSIGYLVTIFDYPGEGDVEFTYISKQPLLHLKGSNTILDGEYLFAG